MPLWMWSGRSIGPPPARDSRVDAHEDRREGRGRYPDRRPARGGDPARAPGAQPVRPPCPEGDRVPRAAEEPPGRRGSSLSAARPAAFGRRSAGRGPQRRAGGGGVPRRRPARPPGGRRPPQPSAPAYEWTLKKVLVLHGAEAHTVVGGPNEQFWSQSRARTGAPMNARPLHDRLVVRRLEQKEVAQGG